jgi:predicted Zn-dependent peptidase
MDATCVLVYHIAGTRDDPPDVKGGSYLFQNLMLRETRNLAGFERLVYIKRSGGISNRMVGYDYSIFFQVVPRSEINNALWLESERISSLNLSDRDIVTEKDNVYRRFYRQINSNVHAWGMNWIKSKIFQGTIYETPVYGKLEEVRNFTPQAIRKLYRNFKNLSNIIMVISGKFDTGEIRRAVSKHFAGLASTPRPPRKQYVSAAPRQKYEFLNRVEDNLNEHFVLFGIRAPAKFSNDHLYFQFLRYYLVDKRIAKLDKILNHDNNLDVTISHHFTDHFEANALVIKISCKSRANMTRARYFVNRLLNALKKGKPGTLSGSEIRTTRSLMEIDFLKNMVTPEARARFLAGHYSVSGSLNAERHYLNRIRAINSYDIYRIGKKFFDKNNRVNLNVYAK